MSKMGTDGRTNGKLNSWSRMYMMVDSFLISDSEDSVGGRLGRQSLGHSVHGEVQAKMMLIMTVCL